MIGNAVAIMREDAVDVIVDGKGPAAKALQDVPRKWDPVSG